MKGGFKTKDWIDMMVGGAFKSCTTWRQLFCIFALPFTHWYGTYFTELLEGEIRWHSTSTEYLGSSGAWWTLVDWHLGTPALGCGFPCPLGTEMNRGSRASPHRCNHQKVTPLTTFPSRRNKNFGNIIFQIKRKFVLGILSWRNQKVSVDMVFFLTIGPADLGFRFNYLFASFFFIHLFIFSMYVSSHPALHKVLSKSSSLAFLNKKSSTWIVFGHMAHSLLEA